MAWLKLADYVQKLQINKLNCRFRLLIMITNTVFCIAFDYINIRRILATDYWHTVNTEEYHQEDSISLSMPWC